VSDAIAFGELQCLEPGGETGWLSVVEATLSIDADQHVAIELLRSGLERGVGLQGIAADDRCDDPPGRRAEERLPRNARQGVHQRLGSEADDRSQLCGVPPPRRIEIGDRLRR